MSRAEGEAFLESLVFGLRLAPEVANKTAAQVATVTAANLLARLGGSVVVDVAPANVKLANLPWIGQSIDRATRSIVEWAGGRVEEHGTPDVWIVVGDQSSENAINVSGDDWTAQVDSVGAFGGQHPLGAAAASCVGAARAFHIALARRLRTPEPSREPVSFSLLTYGAVDSKSPSSRLARRSTGTPDAVLVGAGAVGNGFAWSVAACSLSLGRLAVVDPQCLDESNLNRHVAAGFRDLGRPKAAIVSEFLSLGGSAVSSIVDTFAGISSQRSRMPILLSTVDNDEARYEIQGSFPPLVIHGATSQEHLAVGVLDASSGACLGCLFPRPDLSPIEVISHDTGIPDHLIEPALRPGGLFTEDMVDFVADRFGVDRADLKGFVGHDFRRVYATEICGRLGGRNLVGGGSATVAYVSALAGILVAAEFAKLSDATTHRYVLHNYLQMTPMAPSAAWVVFRDKDPNCPLMCGSAAVKKFLVDRG